MIKKENRKAYKGAQKYLFLNKGQRKSRKVDVK